MKRILFYIVSLLALLSFSGCDEEPVKMEFYPELVDKIEVKIAEVSYTQVSFEILVPEEVLEYLGQFQCMFCRDRSASSTNYSNRTFLSDLKFEKSLDTPGMYKAIWSVTNLSSEEAYSSAVEIRMVSKNPASSWWYGTAYGLNYTIEKSKTFDFDFLTLSSAALFSQMRLSMQNPTASGVTIDLYVPSAAHRLADKVDITLRLLKRQNQNNPLTEEIMSIPSQLLNEFECTPAENGQYDYILYTSSTLTPGEYELWVQIRSTYIDEYKQTYVPFTIYSSETLFSQMKLSAETTATNGVIADLYVPKAIYDRSDYINAHVTVVKVRDGNNVITNATVVSQSFLLNEFDSTEAGKNMYKCSVFSSTTLPPGEYSIKVLIDSSSFLGDGKDFDDTAYFTIS